MPDAQLLDDAPFEILDVAPVVGEPAPVQDLLHLVQEPLPVACVGPADMQRSGKCSRASEDGQVFNA
jgi:hypothetical protein